MADAPGGMDLSFGQQRLWFLDQLAPGNPFYNLMLGHRLSGTLDVAALEWALTEIVARHDALRARFTNDGEVPQQIVEPPFPVALLVKDIREAADPVAAARRLAKGEARLPFDLAAGPLLRARLLRLGDTDHVLLVTMHHIVGDGWSLGIFRSELSVLYRDAVARRPSSLPPLELQYADFVKWQRSWLSGDVLAAQLEYWRARLGDMPVAVDLPTDRARPPVPSYTAGAVSFEIPADAVRRLRALGSQRRATLFMVLLAAFDALLARYTGGTDVVVGVPASGRDRAELEGLIGFFVNNLVLRVDCAGDPTFGELLERVRDSALGAFDHQHLPFERLVEELRPSRDPSRNPLTQVGFQLMQTQPTDRSFELVGIDTIPFDPPGGDAVQFELELHCRETPHGVSARIAYAADLFVPETMERFARHLGHLLEQVNPDVRLSQLRSLTVAEEQQQLVDWNSTSSSVAAHTVVQLFEAQTARTPQAAAVSFEEQTLTYRELNEQANRFAHRLRARGVRPEVVVGLCAEPGLDLMIGLLAILKAGGAYLPLDPDHPGDRTAVMLDDAGCGLVVVQDNLHIDARGAEVVQFDPTADSSWPSHNPATEVSPDNLAYVIYTSGSTGRPKGVEVVHRGVTNMIVFQSRRFGLGPRSRVLQTASICFDASVSEIWITWVSGGELVISPRLLLGAELSNLIAKREITQVALVPSVLATLPETRFPHLETILIGGEVAAPAVVNRWSAGRDVFNVFGPTETTVNASLFKCAGELSTPAPIGRPVANTQIYLLDVRLRPVPVGVSGEVYIGGAGVARGYLRRPGLTGSRFVANPFGGRGSRLYRTGDLARYLPDGNIEFLGRTDNQVKIRGVRVELGEIESTLSMHPGVGQASVAARDDVAGELRVFAYVVPTDRRCAATATDDAALSRQHVRERQLFFDETHRKMVPTQPANPTAVERITALRPERLLEIGCGAGTLLRELLPVCQHYVATELSSAAVDLLRSAPDLNGADGLTLLGREATDFRGFRDQSFDAVVVDSVTQHCPTLSYVDDVVERATTVLRDGGVLIITDVRERADDGELAISPRYFTGLLDRLARAAHVDLIQGDDQYDVVVTVGPPRNPASPRRRPADDLASDPLRARHGAQLAHELREFARQRLPESMVPSGVLVLDRLPRSPNGKVDLRQLPAPQVTSSGRAPSGPAEEALCALFAEVLSCDTVSPDDGFFDMGGHSLLAVRLLNLIRSRLGVEITLRRLFLQPTPAALAHHLTQPASGGAE